jgi:hypothetical protein
MLIVSVHGVVVKGKEGKRVRTCHLMLSFLHCLLSESDIHQVMRTGLSLTIVRCTRIIQDE